MEIETRKEKTAPIGERLQDKNYFKQREAYYFNRRALARIVAERNEEKARSDSRYLQLDRTRKILMLKWVKAEVKLPRKPPT